MNTVKKYVVFLNESIKNDISLLGGKGASLCEITKSGFPVPKGFCLTTDAYKEFIIKNDLYDFLSKSLKGLKLEDVSKIGKLIRDKINNSLIPDYIKIEIVKAIRDLGTEKFYAIRSSATAEDLTYASFAGQQDTYLNIRGEKSIVEKVKACFASLFTDRALLYRIQNKIESENVYMSVVVQEMIQPDISGIMFTADPVSGRRDMISIDASYGLGEALVSGLVSSDIYKFNKKDLKIEEKIISNKKIAISSLKDGGTKQSEVAEDKAALQALDDDKIIKLSELGMKIEAHYLRPQDIEWCISGGLIYILQSRAITSLFPIPSPMPCDDALHAYFSFSHGQVMTDPISPMGISMIQAILPFNKNIRSSNECQYVVSAGGRVYIDLNPVVQIKPLRKRMGGIIKNIDLLMGEALESLVNREDFYRFIKRDRKIALRLFKFMFPIAVSSFKNVLSDDLSNSVQKIDDYVKDRIKLKKEAIYKLSQGIQRLEGLQDILNFAEDIHNLLPFIIPAVLNFKILQKSEHTLLKEAKYVDLIAKGLEGNITTTMGLKMADLADKIRKSKELLDEFQNEDHISLFNRLHNLKGHENFLKDFDAFIEKYGMRGASEIDIKSTRWNENPEALVKSMLAIVKTSKEDIHNKDYANTIKEAEDASKRFIEEVESKRGKLKAKKIRKQIYIFRNTMPIREHPKYLIMNYLDISKKVILEEAKGLVLKGFLECEEDVFYLNYWELCQAVRENKDMRDLILQRKEEYRYYKKLSPPRVMTSNGEKITSSYKKDNIPKDAIAGIAVSSGVVEGIAKVILNPNESSIDKGEILVAPFTDPGWTPLFINAAGLVMEVGGLLTHGTVVAREYGIPAVVGVTDVTKLIKTGQRIRVDGNLGFISIL